MGKDAAAAVVGNNTTATAAAAAIQEAMLPAIAVLLAGVAPGTRDELTMGLYEGADNEVAIAPCVLIGETLG
jgi:hypothetical protein